MSARHGDQAVTSTALNSENTPIRAKRQGRAATNERFLDLVGGILGAKLDYELRGASAAAVARELRRIAEDAAYLAADLDATEAVR